LSAEDFPVRKSRTSEYKEDEAENYDPGNIPKTTTVHQKEELSVSESATPILAPVVVVCDEDHVETSEYSIPAGSALQAVRKSSKLVDVNNEKAMRNFISYPGDHDLAALFVQLADQTRYYILQSKSLSSEEVLSPYFTDLPLQHQIVLIQKCVMALLRPQHVVLNATFFLDVTLHALIRSLVPLISQEIRSEKESGRVPTTDVADGNSEDEDCEAESYCKHRTFVLAFYELSTDSMCSLRRDSTDLKLWLSLVDDITLSIFNVSPKLLTAMETRCEEADEVVGRMLSACEMHHPEWKELYFSDTVISDKQLNNGSDDNEEKGRMGNSCLFWPRDHFTPDDLRFANVCLAALNFEDANDASFFTPFPINNAESKNRKQLRKAERERIDANKEAVVLLQESESSANDAQAHVRQQQITNTFSLHFSPFLYLYLFKKKSITSIKVLKNGRNNSFLALFPVFYS
jgi:hypothetical protein